MVGAICDLAIIYVIYGKLCAGRSQKRPARSESNSVRAEIIYPAIVEFVLGETYYPWWWTYPALHGDR